MLGRTPKGADLSAGKDGIVRIDSFVGLRDSL